MGNQAKVSKEEEERRIALTLGSSRGPGKRQIKPTAAVLSEDIIPDEEEDDDVDFHASMSEMSSGESSSASSDEEGEEEEVKEEVDADVKPSSSQVENESPICSVCLSLREALKNDEVIQCDKCGIWLHEVCYGSNYDQAGDDTSSEHSSSNMEPWFCEPCLFGLKEPPHCEFCPCRYGAFKRSDIGGRWVHLVCMHYTHDINSTFGALEQMSAVSWQEMDHRLFGKRPCGICTDKLDARTGITVNCDTGLCKEYFHVTCAQKMGRLHDINDDFQNATTSDDNALGFYLSCAKHFDPDTAKINRKAYAIFVKQEEARLKRWRRKQLTDREERKRVEGLAKLQKEHTSLIGTSICWPMEHFDQWDKKSKRARLLHTSPEFLEAFEQKAELCGVDNKDFRARFHRLNPTDINYIPPGYSNEFFAYVANREEHVIKEEEARLAEIEKRVAYLKEHGNDPQVFKAELVEAQKRLKNGKDELHEADDLNKRMTRALTILGFKKRPSINIRDNNTLKSPPVKIRKVEVSKKPSPKKKANGVVELKVSEPKKCAQCALTTDQHLLTECDECHKSYHLSCCDPPLERMPRRTANIGWACHNCDEETDEKEETPIVLDGPRSMRQRSDADKAKKVAAQIEQNRAFNAAVRNSRLSNGLKRKSNNNGGEPKNAATKHVETKVIVADGDEEFEL